MINTQVIDCLNKLAEKPLAGRQAIIFMWVKTGFISLAVFRELLCELSGK